MHRRTRLIRTAIGSIATAALTFGMLALAPVGAAFAATQTLIAEQSTVAHPIAGQMVAVQVSTGSVDGSTPAGEVTVGVEGTAMTFGVPANTSTGVLQLNVGTFPLGAIIVDATFTPTSSAYSPTSTRLQVIIVGDSDTIAPLFPATPLLGHAVTVSTILVIAAGNSHAPGGIVGFTVGGVSVGSCTPAATGAARNWSCSATLPAPTAAGPYTVTANFGRSSYYLPASGSATATIAAPPAKATTPVKHAEAAAPVATTVPTGTPTPSASPTARPTVPPTAAPVAAGAATTGVRTSLSTGVDPWAILFVAALALLIAIGVAVLIVLRRRAPGSSR